MAQGLPPIGGEVTQAVPLPPIGGEVSPLPVFRESNAKDAQGNAVVDPENDLALAAAAGGGYTPMQGSAMGSTAADIATGVGKGVANTVVGLGELVHRVPGVTRAVDALYGRPGLSDEAFAEGRRITRPTNRAQQAGFYGEQVGEFFLPVGDASKLAQTAAEIGKAGVLTKAQGGTTGEAAANAGLAAVVPGAGAVRRGAQALEDSAEPLVRAAIKPTVASLRRISGGGGLDAKANAMVRFIIDNRLTTADKARALFQNAEHDLQRVLSVSHAPTDAAERAERYLSALERSASAQGLPAGDVAQIRNAAAELLDGPMGKDVVTMVPQPHPTLVDPKGNPITVLVPQTSRTLRTDVTAKEALDSARASSRWGTRKQWGEQKGAAMEATKAVERAQRDAVKVAVPETRAILQKEAKSLQAVEALDRMGQRAANRDAVSLPAHVVAAGEVATGRVPYLAFAANWLRNNQMKVGIWNDALGKAIQRGNAPLVADILKRLGVSAESEAMRTPATAQ